VVAAPPTTSFSCEALDSVVLPMPNSSHRVLPTTTHPARLRLSTTVASRGGAYRERARLPAVALNPAAQMLSFTPRVTPASGRARLLSSAVTSFANVLSCPLASSSTTSASVPLPCTTEFGKKLRSFGSSISILFR